MNIYAGPLRYCMVSDLSFVVTVYHHDHEAPVLDTGKHRCLADDL